MCPELESAIAWESADALGRCACDIRGLILSTTFDHPSAPPWLWPPFDLGVYRWDNCAAKVEKREARAIT
jgi:hypothetical protein